MLRPIFTALTVLGLGAAVAGPPLVPTELRELVGGLFVIVLVVGWLGAVRTAAVGVVALSPLLAFVGLVATSSCQCGQHGADGPWWFLAVLAALVVGNGMIALVDGAAAEVALPRARARVR